MLYVLASTAQLCALSAQFPLACRALIECAFDPVEAGGTGEGELQA